MKTQQCPICNKYLTSVCLNRFCDHYGSSIDTENAFVLNSFERAIDDAWEKNSERK